MRKKIRSKLAGILLAAVLLSFGGATGYAPAVSASPIVADINWRPIDTTMAVAPGSAMDLSFLNADPAGTNGFVEIDEYGDYYFEDDPDTKVKFYGGNLNGSYMVDPTREEMVIMADRIAAMGYNVVRYSSIDQNYDWAKGLMQPLTSTTVALNTSKLDNFDYFNALLKSRGVYIDLDIMSFSNFKNVPSIGESVYGSTASKYLATLLPDGKAIWQSFAYQLFNHVNPYTGLALKDEPQIMGVSPINEVILYNANFSNPNFNAWVLADFNLFLTGKGKPALTTFPNNFWEASPSIRDDLAEYFTELQFAAYGEMKSYLKNVIGIKAPIGGINYINDSLANYWRTQADVHETHLYNGLVDGRGASFKYNPLTHPRYSMIFAPESSANYVSQYGSFIFKNYVPALALGQLYNKPFALTEFNHEFPNKGRDDIGLMTAATGAYQGWDMLNRFHYVSRVNEAINETAQGGTTSFDSLTDVIATMSEYQGTLVFRQAHLAPADAKFVIVRDKTYVKTHASATENESPERNRTYIPHLFKMVTVYADHPAEPYTIYKITPELTDEQIASGDIPAANKITIANSMTLKEVAETFILAIDDVDLKSSMLANLNNNKLVSDTGELLFDLNLNTYFINTPYVVAAAGTLDNNSYELGPVTMSANLPKGTLSVASLDNEPLDESERMLIIYTTDAAATGEYEETVSGSTYYHRGTAPTLAKYGTAEVQLQTTRPAGDYKAYKLSMNGVRLQEIPTTVLGDTITVPMETDKGYGFELVYAPLIGTDVTAPTSPANVAAVSPFSTKVDLSWDKSTDNAGVSEYKIYRNGTEYASVNGNVNTYVDKGVTALTPYNYVIKAIDPSGNVSTGSITASVTTSDIIFYEGFESGSTAWTVASSWGSYSIITDGSLHAYRADNLTKGGSKSTAGDTNWQNYSIEAKVKANSWSGTVGRMGLVARFSDNNNYFYVYYDDHAGRFVLRKTVGGIETNLASVSLSLSTGVQHLFKLEVNGTTIKAYVNGQLKIDVTESELPTGKIGVYTHFAQADFDDVFVRAIP
ncbi:family 16 glycoside hydrolase [Paenibacillus sinopodophylli]|uniref:family 16 glycoside hydrolase n=1 Tax=Paenibacillus sinopodophylli TaxID=1837342 RepID=UPI00110CDBC8|nr:family 16 glycoside hydrolase [Paenibacillus sinopodophylli]